MYVHGYTKMTSTACDACFSQHLLLSSTCPWALVAISCKVQAMQVQVVHVPRAAVMAFAPLSPHTHTNAPVHMRQLGDIVSSDSDAHAKRVDCESMLSCISTAQPLRRSCVHLIANRMT